MNVGKLNNHLFYLLSKAWTLFAKINLGRFRWFQNMSCKWVRLHPVSFSLQPSVLGAKRRRWGRVVLDCRCATPHAQSCRQTPSLRLPAMSCKKTSIMIKSSPNQTKWWFNWNQNFFHIMYKRPLHPPNIGDINLGTIDLRLLIHALNNNPVL